MEVIQGKTQCFILVDIFLFEGTFTKIKVTTLIRDSFDCTLSYSTKHGGLQAELLVSCPTFGNTTNILPN